MQDLGNRIKPQNGANELEQWYGKAGEREATVSDYLAGRSNELPEHHDIFPQYRDWFVSVIIPAVANHWNVHVTACIIGWRPHQHETWDCEPGQTPVERHPSQ